jgi:hypothetical protein
VCQQKQVRDQLCDVLLDQLLDAYRKAMDHARFLLSIERGGKPTTYNHYFNAKLQKRRNERMCESLKCLAVSVGRSEDKYIPLQALNKHAVDKENGQQIREDILDTLISYYKVSRKRFVDIVCQQVVHYFLLDSNDSPLTVFSPELVMRLDTDQLELIAGESTESKSRRQVLELEIQSLEAALKVLRT